LPQQRITRSHQYRVAERGRATIIALLAAAPMLMVTQVGALTAEAVGVVAMFVDVLAATAIVQHADPAPVDQFANSVSISGDTMIAGAHANDGPVNSGAAYIFERDAGGPDNWGQVAKLIASDASQKDQFGIAVAVDGNTAVVGAFAWDKDDANDDNKGAVYIFQRDLVDPNVWVEVQMIPGPVANRANFGGHVAIDGNTIAVGAFKDFGGGSVTVYDRDPVDPNLWNFRTKITPPLGSTQFGIDVAISGDTLLVAQLTNQSAHFFERDQGGIADSWGLSQTVTGGPRYGWSADVDGDTAVVGAPGIADPTGVLLNVGAVYLLERNGAGGWVPHPTLLRAGNGLQGDQLGIDVSVSGDFVVAGAFSADLQRMNAGTAYVFSRDDGGVSNWGEVLYLFPVLPGFPPGDPAGTKNFFFGKATAISGARVVVGAPFNPRVVGTAGFAYVYDLTVPDPVAPGYVLDGLGGLHPGGGAAPMSPATPYFGFDIAVDLELAATGFYVLDGFGGVHAGGGALPLSPPTPYFGFNVAADLELAVVGFYVLDGFGGVYAGGGAPMLVPPTPYFGFDVARDLELATIGYYVLDGWGGVHPGGGAPILIPGSLYFGFDLAVDMELASTGYYVLDSWGGVHVGAGAPLLTPPTPYFGFDVARDMELVSTGYYVLDGFGGVHAGGGAPAMFPSTAFWGFDVARDLELQ